MTDQQKLQALVHLSSWRQVPAVEELTRLICQSPDPETARRAVLGNIDRSSEVICQKWAETVDHLWLAEHPGWPLLLHLPLATADVGEVAAVAAAREFLAGIAERPAQFIEEESLPMRRLQSLLVTIRLLRVRGGQLVLNRGRYQRWLEFPELQQFYILWHADTHHLDWSALVGLPWQPYLQLIQEYLPVIWDISYRQAPTFRTQSWSEEITSAMAWVWGKYERFALPQVVEQIVMHDLFARYDLVHLEGPYATWTRVGQAMIASELNASLPCGMTLLE